MLTHVHVIYICKKIIYVESTYVLNVLVLSFGQLNTAPFKMTSDSKIDALFCWFLYVSVSKGDSRLCGK